MKICVFGGASNVPNKKYAEEAFRLCRMLAERGHDLVFGGGRDGMMGAAARGFHAGGAKITGVVPEFFRARQYEILYLEAEEIIYTEDIAERIRLMERMSDAFVAFPGGAGTYEELFKILVSKSLDRHTKPLALFSIDGYFDPLVSMLQYSHSQGFISENSLHNLRVFREQETDELIRYLEGITEPLMP